MRCRENRDPRISKKTVAVKMYHVLCVGKYHTSLLCYYNMLDKKEL